MKYFFISCIIIKAWYYVSCDLLVISDIISLEHFLINSGWFGIIYRLASIADTETYQLLSTID